MARDDIIFGWLCTLGSLLIGLLLLIDPIRFVSSPAWQTTIGMAPSDPNSGRILLGWLIVLLGVGMAAAMITGRFVWLPFILASLWFCFVTVALSLSTFTIKGSGTPGFVVWGLVALALMNFGVKFLPARQ